MRVLGYAVIYDDGGVQRYSRSRLHHALKEARRHRFLAPDYETPRVRRRCQAGEGRVFLLPLSMDWRNLTEEQALASPFAKEEKNGLR